MHLHLQHDVGIAHGGLGVHRQGVVDGGHLLARKLDVYNRSDDTDDTSHSPLLFCSFFSHLFLQSCGAADDLVDLGRDGALADAVVVTLQRLNHFVRVIGCGFHCVAASTLLAGGAVN